MNKRISIVRDKNENPYLMIRLTYEEFINLGDEIEAHKMLMKKNES